MIVYRKASQLRIKRSSVPEPPYWYATALAPYGARRLTPVAIDYLELRASSAERLEVSICNDVSDEIERAAGRQPLQPPALIEAAEFAEAIFGRGEEALRACREVGLPAIHLVSTRGALPVDGTGSTVVIATWPLEFERLETLFATAAERQLEWGVAVPVMFPVTTNLEALQQIAEAAHRHGARFLTTLPLDVDATARQAIAQSLTIPGEDETYAMLFHADLEPVHVATERHLAAVAAELGLSDYLLPPQWSAKTNWNAAIVLTLAATRMLAMAHEIELAGTLARSARIVAELDKPLTRIAEAASLSIVEALDEVSVDILSEWLETGRSVFLDRVSERWRLRRDYRTSDAAP